MAILLKGAGTYKRAFLMVLASDHISPATGLTPVVSISKAGGAFGAPSISANATEITASGPGWYYISLSSTDTNTAGDLVVHAAVATADNTDFVDQVWDPAVAMTGVNVVNWLGTVVATPATSGIPDINVKNMNNIAATSVTTINANIGETQPINFTGTGASAFVQTDVKDFGGTAGTFAAGVPLVSTTSNVKKNTASSGFMFGMTDSTLHTPKTGLTVAAQVSIDGGAFASAVNSPTEISNGAYTLNLAAADVNGNHIMLLFTATGADNLLVEIVTQP